jgi:hypothetical protein
MASRLDSGSLIELLLRVPGVAEILVSDDELQELLVSW